MKARRLIAESGGLALVGPLALCVPAGVHAQPAANEGAYEQDGAKTTRKTFHDQRGVRFCELFFIRAKGDDQYEVHIYNPTGLNNAAATREACPDALLNKVDLKGLKTQYKLDALI